MRRNLLVLPLAALIVLTIPFSPVSATDGDNDPGVPTLIAPDLQYLIEAYHILPLEDTIYIGRFDSHVATDIDPTSLKINGTLDPLSTAMLPVDSIEGLTGEVMQITVLRHDFLMSYGLVFDSAALTYTVEGMLYNKCPFEVEGDVTIRGHVSGDLNADGVANIVDIRYLISHIYEGGPPARPLPVLSDFNEDGQINLLDILDLIAFMLE